MDHCPRAMTNNKKNFDSELSFFSSFATHLLAMLPLQGDPWHFFLISQEQAKTAQIWSVCLCAGYGVLSCTSLHINTALQETCPNNCTFVAPADRNIEFDVLCLLN